MKKMACLVLIGVLLCVALAASAREARWVELGNYLLPLQEKDEILDVYLSNPPISIQFSEYPDIVLEWSKKDALASFDELLSNEKKRAEVQGQTYSVLQSDDGLPYITWVWPGNYTCGVFYVFQDDEYAYSLRFRVQTTYTQEIRDSCDAIFASLNKIDRVQRLDDYKALHQAVTYKYMARNPERTKGEHVTVTGEVRGMQEDGLHVTLRVNVTKNSWGYSDTILVEYTRESEWEDRILEDDIITIWGTLNGLQTYQSSDSLPLLLAEYIQIDSLDE